MTKQHIRTNRQSMRVDIAASWYWCDIAPTVVFVPDFMVVAWSELCGVWDDDALRVWSELLHDWPARPLRYIDSATDLVREYISLITCGHLTAEPSS
jgi:hypothetical protein